MSGVLNECRKCYVWYLNNIFMFSNDTKSHHTNLKVVIEKVVKVGLILNYPKIY